MARKFGSVNVEMWNDPEFRKLPPAAQHLYLLLWTAPNLSFCGVHDWRPARLTHLSNGFTEEHTKTVADCLAARYFLVVDEGTEEVLIRSWARFDGLLKQPKLAVSYAYAYAEVYSPNLRRVLAHEAEKMHQLWPDLACWKDSRLQNILSHEAVSAKDLPVPQDPFGPGFATAVTPGLALGLDQTQPKVYPSVYPPPTPAPTPTPNTDRGDVAVATTPTKKKVATRLPESWQPSEAHRLLADERLLNLDDEAAKFKDHAIANDRRQSNWDASFRNWLRGSKNFGSPAKPSSSRPTNVHDLEMPPDGLSPAEYAEWDRQQRTKRGGA